MRGEDSKQEAMFSYLSPEKRVPAEHPLRRIREMVDRVLGEMSPRFAKLYAGVGRPSIAPERLLRALLLQIFYSVRSGRRPGPDSSCAPPGSPPSRASSSPRRFSLKHLNFARGYDLTRLSDSSQRLVLGRI
jgi:hypothetical protein